MFVVALNSLESDFVGPRELLNLSVILQSFFGVRIGTPDISKEQ
jgi:hypothetical protein